MSDSNDDKPGMPPPDDWSKTTPNIPAEDFEESEWGKTNYGTPSDAPADEWGKTVINYNVSGAEPDLGKQLHPSKEEFSEPDWGVTQPNVRLNDDFEPESNEDSNDGMTVPYLRLPDAEREKYAKIPPTPSERARQDEEKRKKAGGIPAWFWIGAGLMTMFSFAVIVLLAVYFFFMGPSAFTIQIKGAQPNSQFFVNNSRWGVENPQGEVDLIGLSPGTKKLIVRKKGFEDFETNVDGKRGEVVTVLVAQKASANECQNAESMTDIAKREECANIILNNLDSPPNVDDLLRALNLYYINFASGDASIPAARQKFLERASTYIKQLPDKIVIEIGGHTDDVGDDASNMDLSNRRANAVKDYFVKTGLSEARFTTKGYGETQPKEANNTEEGRFQNRRISYMVVAK
ncbi:MAG: OmpA family protein [Pyrinomonadaceae bacterium]